MGTINGPSICRPTLSAKDARSCSPTIYSPVKIRNISGSFWGCRGHLRVETISTRQFKRRGGAIRCKFSSSSDGNGRMAENFNENDDNYVNSVVTEAVEVRSSSDGFIIKMRDGKHVQCIHNNPHARYSADYTPRPAIVLKMDDGSGLLLPIIVLELPSVLLMAAIRNVHIARPTVYEVIKDMIEKIGYKVHFVRVTERVQESYFAKLYLAKSGDEMQKICFDLRPSDAINIAVRCKVPIQVNKELVFTDGMRMVEPFQHSIQPSSGEPLFSDLDRPSNHPCLETIEFNLVRNMLVAVVEERYKDAAQWRDKLAQLRSKGANWT